MRRVHGLEQARDALTQGARDLCSPPFAACHAGVHYYRAMLDQLHHEFPDVDFTFALCCGDDAAIAHDALRMGFTHVHCDCGQGQFAQLQAIAKTGGATVLMPRNALDPATDAAKPM
jgi:hypothetical protein